MKGLYEYIYESFDNDFKLSPKDKDLLLRYDDLFDKYATEYEREHTSFANVTNIKEEIENILDAVKEGVDYKLNLKYEKSKLGDDKWCDKMIEDLNDLKHKFINLDCYLSKFYIYRINKFIEQIIFLNKYSKNPELDPHVTNVPSEKLYKQAIKIIKENPYVDVKKLAEKDKDYERNVGPEESKKRLQAKIDELGYGWKVVIDDNMVPRMSVRPYKEFRINGGNNFSEVDLQSLEVHEIAVHTARKYYGLQTGLKLFTHGLMNNNIYDEGLAIYNSLHKTKKPKPNILFYACMKVIIAYHMFDKTLPELFNICRKYMDVDDRKIALSLIRMSRVYIYNSLGNYTYDIDYLKGYLKVKDLTDEEREKLLHLAVGPDHVHEMDTILKFLKVNKFKPVEV